MKAREQIREFIIDNGPSTWSEIQDATKVSKGTLTNCLSEQDDFNSTSLPSTLYNVVGTKRPHTLNQIIRHLVKDAARALNKYVEDARKLGKEHAEANLELAIHNILNKYGKLMGHE